MNLPITLPNRFFISLTFVFCAAVFNSCKKDSVLQGNHGLSNRTGAVSESKFVRNFDPALLREFRDYYSSFVNNPEVKASYSFANLDSFKTSRLNMLIDNYLLYVADSLTGPNIKSSSASIVESESSSMSLLQQGIPSSKTCAIQGTSNGLLVQVVINPATQKIMSMSYAITGFHAYIKQVGVIEETVSSGVNTFKFYLQGTWTYQGVNFSSVVVVYGNIFQNQLVSLGAMLLPV